MKRFVILMLALALAGMVGCASKQKTAEAPPPEPAKEEVVIVEKKEVKPAPTAMEIYEMNYQKLPTTHTVVKGDCLWCIAEQAQIYNDPFMWPLIYKSNRAKITKSPDLIYPGQVFDIPRTGMSLADIKDARKQAGAPWKKLEPAATANRPAAIRQELGYGF